MTRAVTVETAGSTDKRHDDAIVVWNRYGHFVPDGSEFRITDPKTPRPWANIIATPRMGIAVSQTGSGFTWIDNAQLGVITRWEQDLASDSSGKFLYVRDVDSGELWSLSPAPVWAPYEHFECRHGIGYTTFRTTHLGIEANWTLFCHADQPAELWRVELRNRSDRTRRLELCGYLEWCCGVAPSPRREFHKLFIDTSLDVERRAIIARNHMWEVPTPAHGHWNRDFPYVSAFAVSEPILSAQGDKAAFVGRYGHVAQPAALGEGTWIPRFGRFEDPVAALRSVVVLRPDESRKVGYVVAASTDEAELDGVLAEFSSVDAIDAALEGVTAGWRSRLADHRVETPDVSINYLVNDWLRYQAISGRLWGRCGYYQQSGAYGFRDQLQDSMVWLTTEPHRCREQINLHAAHQFADGSVYHWWHPLSEQGLVTKMTDDLLWLALVTANYIRETGDLSVLEDRAPFLDEDSPAPLAEHIRRAFARVFQRTSPRGLPYIGAGDWNDGLSAVGLQERGESIWLGHFLAGLLSDWSSICEQTGDVTQARDLSAKRASLVSAINEHGWDGNWYIRATLDDGSKLGSAECRVGRIFLNAQTWAILNDVADAPRARRCLDSIKEHLVSKAGALLLTPAYDKSVTEIGYITRYAPGLRENGGVYTHAATWAIAAAAKMRDAELVGQLLSAMNPANKNPEEYWAEPYVTPGNVDGPESPYFGRGGWTWYTGSATWLHRVVNEWVLGVRPTWDGLLVDPCLPAGWTEAKMTRPYRGSTYDIHIERVADRTRDTAAEVWLDGEKLVGNVISPQQAGRTYTVRAICS